MTTEFLIQLGAVFTVISGILLGILKWNGERFKIKVDDDNVKRKEVSELLQKLYDDTRAELQEVKRNHKEEIELMKKEHIEAIETLKREHKEEMLRRDEHNHGEILKRDVIISELIVRLPKEAREAVVHKMHELELEVPTSPPVSEILEIKS